MTKFRKVVLAGIATVAALAILCAGTFAGIFLLYDFLFSYTPTQEHFEWQFPGVMHDIPPATVVGLHGDSDIGFSLIKVEPLGDASTKEALGQIMEGLQRNLERRKYTALIDEWQGKGPAGTLTRVRFKISRDGTSVIVAWTSSNWYYALEKFEER